MNKRKNDEISNALTLKFEIANQEKLIETATATLHDLKRRLVSEGFQMEFHPEEGELLLSRKKISCCDSTYEFEVGIDFTCKARRFKNNGKIEPVVGTFRATDMRYNLEMEDEISGVLEYCKQFVKQNEFWQTLSQDFIEKNCQYDNGTLTGKLTFYVYFTSDEYYCSDSD